MTEAERILTDVCASDADSTAIGTGCSQTNAADTFFDSVCESDTANERYEALCAYLDGEAEALSMLNEHLQGKRRIPEQTMEQLLADRDYLYSHFPDAVRSYSLDLGFLKRTGIELRYLLKILD